ncbi:Vesicle-trafficking protein SEC22b [Trichoplax sp. H2]|uniref:Vesicle-trafficking protein SEC22b n=1 Tax=Trichoplax adhaerens TaxID=10228 RepID=B3RPB1_TRIAD|nr:hypothetical protein TRIADDRAFT_20955 [Trichoplax adhaerens]EDV28157.1 hypothetical protein TRIADDRAFT_20955 [Trichoplax adhaerens]RDD45444.1 Vesicle-trafficking protein SEC22b [Trichoplax sp. H2]|eukprot:XP_002109991.1 hypothetical protein TRIADDRAFT_20955 [Trichoplax adhaerens]
MVLMTLIARVADGLIMAASMQESEEVGKTAQQYQNQAKMLFRKLSDQSPTRCSIETGPYVFHYLIDTGVCFMALCEKTFSKRLVFGYLNDLQAEFIKLYGSEIRIVSRPYCFIEFETFLLKTKKSYMDSRSHRNLNQLNDDLHDVQRIMLQNIDDILQRGEQLSVLDDKASHLSMHSQKYKKDAKYLNLRSTYAKYAVIGFLFFLIVIYLRFWWW